jgi:hypothetical protein
MKLLNSVKENEMIIRGTVQDGLIRINVRGILPEGSSVLVTPIEAPQTKFESTYDLKAAKAKIREVIDLPSVGPNDGFSCVDHDKILYGDTE